MVFTSDSYWKVYAVLIPLALVYCCVKWIGPILFPTVIAYPWPGPSLWNKRDKDRTIVLAGSFNPPHKGHLAMIQYLSLRYGRLIVVVGMNPAKFYRVTPQRRADLLRQMLRGTAAAKNTHVQVVGGYIWRTVRRQGANLFVRGIRSWEQDGREERSLHILNTWGPLVLGPLWWPVPTIFLKGKPDYNHVSSSLIRELCSSSTTMSAPEREELLATLVPDSIVGDVAKLYGRA